MKKIALLLLFVSLMNKSYSGNGTTAFKLTDKDPSKEYLGTGFTLTATAGLNRGITSGSYRLTVVPDQSNSISNVEYQYALKNTFGYRAGIGIGFQSRVFGLEIPITYNVERYKVPDLGSDAIKMSTIEFGENNYFKFLKEKHFIVFGPYFALDKVQGVQNSTSLCALGLNIGYGYNILKRLNVSLRYRYNAFTLGSDNQVMEVEKAPYESTSTPGEIYYRASASNSVQLVVRFDLVNTRKSKTREPKNTTPAPVVKRQPAPAPAQNNTLQGLTVVTEQAAKPVAVNYAAMSDTDLNQAMVNAKARGDNSAIASIQAEQDKRKPKNEFENVLYSQLKIQLEDALKVEDFIKADKLKTEIAKRDVEIDELTKQLNELLAKEDYFKAQEIQDKINAKKK